MGVSSDGNERRRFGDHGRLAKSKNEGVHFPSSLLRIFIGILFRSYIRLPIGYIGGIFMSSIAKWIHEVPGLKNRDRLLSVLHTLGVATREQLEVVTGWSSNKVKNLLKEIRDQFPIPEYHRQQKQLLEQAKKSNSLTEIEVQQLEMKVTRDIAKIEKGRNSWVTILQPEGQRGGSFYTLGKNGIVLAKEIRREYVENTSKLKPKTQTTHFYGVNEILCRLRKLNIVENDWLSAGEVMQDLHYYWNQDHKGKGIPYRPDCLLQLDEDKYYGEFDTGSESNGRLRNRFKNCLTLYRDIDDPKWERLPKEIIWVCTNTKRKERIEQIAKEVLQDFMKKNRGNIRIPTVYCFVEGDDTRFLLGELEAVPFWG